MKYFYAAVNDAGEVKSLSCSSSPLPPSLLPGQILKTLTQSEYGEAQAALMGDHQQVILEDSGMVRLPFWRPDGLPPTTKARRRLYEVTVPLVLTLTWEGGPLLLSVNRQPPEKLSSPLEIDLQTPGRYVIESKDPRWTDTEYRITAI